MITGLDQVQIAMPAGGERAGLEERGCAVTRSDGELPGIRRFHTSDPFGNRLEFQQG